MYTDVINVRLLISLLKSYDVKYAVLSSGTCSIPMLQSLEADSFFTCYSDIDERSAVYFAIGIAQMRKAPVVVVCTSGTAASNYLPGICEAQKIGVPLIIVTCDKDPHTLGHLTIQKINQHNMYASNCTFSATIPVIKDALDNWAAKTYITQAIIKCLTDSAPVHINLYTDGDKQTFNTPDLPLVSAVSFFNYFDLRNNRHEIVEELDRTQKILIIIGEHSPFSKEETDLIDKFCEQYGAVVLGEHVANIHGKYTLNGYRLVEQISYNIFEDYLKPDLVISFGGNFASYEIKTLLKHAHVKHWWIDPSGSVVDIWRSINTIFQCSPVDFFKILVKDKDSIAKESIDNSYYDIWKNEIDRIVTSCDTYSSMYVVRKLCEQLNGCRLLHLGILNSTRLIHLQDIPNDIHTYSNLGALGIDGSLSTFLGQVSALQEGYGLLILGDLSFFYDINSLYKTSLSSKVKIVLLNNGGGCEFHLNTGLEVIPTLDNYISAGHNSKAKEWVEALGFKYFSAENVSSFTNALSDFFNENEAPAFFEVFSDMETDANVIKEMYHKNGYSVTQKQTAASLKKILINTIGVKRTQKLVKIAKIWRDE